MLNRILFLGILILLLAGCTVPSPAKTSAAIGQTTVSFRIALPQKRQVQATDFDALQTCSILIQGENNTQGVWDSFQFDPAVKSYTRSLTVKAGRNLVADVRFQDEDGTDIIWLKGVFTAKEGLPVTVPVNWATTVTGYVLKQFENYDDDGASRNGLSAVELQKFVNSLVQASGSHPVTWGTHPAMVRILPIKIAIDRLLAQYNYDPAAITAERISSEIATTSADVDEDLGRKYPVLPGGIDVLVQLVDPTGSQSFSIPTNGGYVAEHVDTDHNGTKDAYAFQGPVSALGALNVHVNDPVSVNQQITPVQSMFPDLPPGIWTVSCLDGTGYSPKPWWELGTAQVTCNLMENLDSECATVSLPFHSLATTVKIDGTVKKGTAYSTVNGSWYSFEPATTINTYTVEFSGVAAGKQLRLFNDYDDTRPVQLLQTSSGTAGTFTNVLSDTRCVVYLPNQGASVSVTVH